MNQELENNRAKWSARALVDWMEEGGTIPEAERAQVHALTRKVTVSDAELDRLSEQIEPHAMRRVALYAALRDLRDQYEERGEYAPAVQPEEVKR